MSDVKMVTRRVVGASEYNVYSQDEKGGLTLKKTITVQGKPDEDALAKELNVNRVVCVLVATHKLVYGVSVEEYMKHAKIVKDTKVDAKGNEIKDNEEKTAEQK